ncbi:MAG: S41 family peptidase [Candidatus Caenarcaniphilales bacterium]|nr:S41 family peptidase [Candidatus Caenarcaniphilales bacterium]
MVRKNFGLVFKVLLVINFLALPIMAETRGTKAATKDIAPNMLYELVRLIVNNDYIDPNLNGQNITDWSVDKKYKNKLETYNDATQAIKTMLASLTDKQTKFFSREEYAAETEIVDGTSNHAGVGLKIQRVSNKTTIQPLSENAVNSGLMPKDELIRINDKAVENLTLSEMRPLLVGNEGSTVKLTIKRDSSENKEFTVKRTKNPLLVIPEWQIGKLEPKVCYIRISSFSYYKTADELSARLTSLGKCPSLILDLRENPGGLLDSIKESAGVFLPNDTVIGKLINRDKKVVDLFASKAPTSYDGNLILLVNKGSDNGTEILVAALKDLRKAIVVGETTGGNDSIRLARDLPNGFGMVITTARILTSQGKSFHEVGIEPDYKVPLSQENIRNKMDAWFNHANLFLSPQTELSKDLQLMKAKELALEK